MSSAEKVPAAILIIFSLFVGIALVVRHYLHQKPIEGNYNPVSICDGAVGSVVDSSLEFSTRDEFVLDLPDGCFGGWVRIPSTWKYWRLEPVGDQHNWWIAFWYPDDDRGLGPYVLNQQLIINQPFKAPFRLQGNGRVRFYTDISSHELESRAK